MLYHCVIFQKTQGLRLLENRKEAPKGGARRCFDDGNRKVGKDCTFDLAACASRLQLNPSKVERYAFVFTHDLRKKWYGFDNTNLQSMLKFARAHDIDVVLVVPAHGSLDTPGQVNFGRTRKTMLSDAQQHGVQVIQVGPSGDGWQPPSWNTQIRPLSDKQKADIRGAGVKLSGAAFVAPPGINQTVEDLNGDLAIQDFMKMNAFGLEQYDAIVLYDMDIELTGRGDSHMMDLFKCASQNVFLSTSGPMSFVNVGFMAIRPSRKLLAAMAHFVERTHFDKTTYEWKSLQFAKTKIPGQQILYYTFFLENSSDIENAFRSVDLARPTAAQLDRCTWNFQHEWGCPTPWDCSNTFAIHKSAMAGREDAGLPWSAQNVSKIFVNGDSSGCLHERHKKKTTPTTAL